ncbi:DUF305 domain-containing protein [Krasilnikoviella flava]|uniref:Uncharacterized conserved protein, DUF305 family n=1 Tax=Krasilnikoviella flava TaxID=526729 RepID=A0A1T5K2W8_9MICO|nr:DUF305 domain-containing protein [Krasilnikoviella flava]SKC57865.1 Uncharacterized conserved protein, DUF305 family [Krasilnikoviella flava]
MTTDPRIRRTGGRRAALTCVVALTLGLSAGCTAEEPAPAPTPSSAVLAPGKPGEPARTIAPDDYEGMGDVDVVTDADADFMTQMIGHHAQAVEMAQLVPERSTSAQIEKFAERIRLTQDGEIQYMSRWLTDHGLPVPAVASPSAAPSDGSGPRAPQTHDHDSMPGMLTDAEMEALADADGTAFDRLFLEGMIQHHGGALEMVEDVSSAGRDETVQEFSANVAADQIAEIDRMSRLLDELAG